MRLRAIVGVMLTLLLIGMLTLAFNTQPAKAEPRTWTVDDDGPADFHTIQEAINAASPEDTIFVQNGTYYEHVVVNKSISLIGENRHTTIIDGSRIEPAVHVKADNVIVNNFKIQNGGIRVEDFSNCSVSDNNIKNWFEAWEWYGVGIMLDHSSNCSISNNNVSGGYMGIQLRHSFNCSISSNTVKYHDYGILLYEGSSFSILGNNVEDNYYGVLLGGITIRAIPPRNTVLRNNNMTGNQYNFGFRMIRAPLSILVSQDIDTSNTVDGKPIYYWVNQQDKVVPADAGYVAIINSTNITVENLTLRKNSQGVLFAYTTNSTIRNVTVIRNSLGILLGESSGCSVSGSNVVHNEDGIQLFYSSSCSISHNNVKENWVLHNWIPGSIPENVLSNGVGIWVHGSGNVIYHNNFVNNEDQAVAVAGYANSWDDGYPSGGNYWSDYRGVDYYSGSYQNETGSDGIGDAPCIIEYNNVDNYPLMKPYPWHPHDIGITRIWSKSVVGQGFNLRIDVTTFNYGIDTENFNITAYANTTIIDTPVNIILTSRNSTTVTFTWNTTEVAKGKYSITINASQVPGEADLSDNTYIGWIAVAMLGDITGPDGWPDGKCNMKDISKVARLFGVEHSDPRYDPNCDVVYDGKINMRDISAVARHFGETEP